MCYAMICYDEWKFMRLYAMVWDYSAMQWYFNECFAMMYVVKYILKTDWHVKYNQVKLNMNNFYFSFNSFPISKTVDMVINV